MMHPPAIFFSPKDIKDILKGIFVGVVLLLITGYPGIAYQKSILLFLAVLIILSLVAYTGYSLSQVKNKQKEKLKTDVLESPRTIVRIYAKDAVVQTTYILPGESKERITSIVASHDAPETGYIKVNEKALSSVIISLFDKQHLKELGSIEIFQAFDILQKTFSKIPFLTDEFKKALVASITWKYVGMPSQQKFGEFRASLDLKPNESQLFDELVGLSKNDRVVGLILPKIRDLEDMDLITEEKTDIFDNFYNGLRKTALRKYIDNLGVSNMFYVGLEGKEPEEVIEDDLEVIRKVKLKQQPESEIILEARGTNTKLAAQIAGILLDEDKNEFAIGRITITTHKYPDEGERPKIWITLLKKKLANKKELRYYDKMEKKIFGRISELRESEYCIEKGEDYNIRKAGYCIKSKGEMLIVAGYYEITSKLDNVLNTMKYFSNEEKRILKADCVISHMRNPTMFILVSEIGFFSNT